MNIKKGLSHKKGKKKKRVKIKKIGKRKIRKPLRKVQKKLSKHKEKKKKEEQKIMLKGNETLIDLLYKRVQQKGQMSLGEVMKYFHISKEVAEEWVDILEKHNFITLEYPFFGDPILKKVKPGVKKTEYGE